MITMIFDRFSWESLFFAPVLKQVINSVASLLTDQTHPFHLSDMLRFGGDEIEPGCFNTGMAQHIRQLNNISCHAIECSSEKVTQIMGEHFRCLHFCFYTQHLHGFPDLIS